MVDYYESGSAPPLYTPIVEDHLNNEKLTPFVRRFIRSWKQRLGLHGWVVTWAWASQDEVDGVANYAAYAVTTYDTSKQQAFVEVSRERPWQIKDRYAQNYLPGVLLHELTHIRVSGGEVLLGDLGAILHPYMPEVTAAATQNAAIGIREFYVDTIVTLLLNQEEQWRLQKSK